MKLILKCVQCSDTFSRYVTNSTTDGERKYCCSNACRSEYQKQSMLGSKNPNFNKRWTEQAKKQQSLRVKDKLKDPIIRSKIGSANRGKTFSADRIKAMHGSRTPESYSRQHTVETKAKIGLKSQQKWTDTYKQQNRKIREQKGQWKPLTSLNDIQVYYRESNWIQRMYDIVGDLKILNECGVFNSKKNPKGLVRDHMFNRLDGFKNGVFPEILRHPANCQIITHSENVHKRTNSSLSLEDLFQRIRSFNGEWIEHQTALELIESYQKGNRWNNRYRKEDRE